MSLAAGEEPREAAGAIVAKVLRMTASRFDRNADSVVILWGDETQRPSRSVDTIDEDASLLTSGR
jgi:hypothetical protein